MLPAVKTSLDPQYAAKRQEQMERLQQRSLEDTRAQEKTDKSQQEYNALSDEDKALRMSAVFKSMSASEPEPDSELHTEAFLKERRIQDEARLNCQHEYNALSPDEKKYRLSKLFTMKEVPNTESRTHMTDAEAKLSELRSINSRTLDDESHSEELQASMDQIQKTISEYEKNPHTSKNTQELMDSFKSCASDRASDREKNRLEKEAVDSLLFVDKDAQKITTESEQMNALAKVQAESLRIQFQAAELNPIQDILKGMLQPKGDPLCYDGASNSEDIPIPLSHQST